MLDYPDSIPPEFRKEQGMMAQNFTLADFADQVTVETLDYFLLRLEHESRSGGEYRERIMEMAAVTLGMPLHDLKLKFLPFQVEPGCAQKFNLAEGIVSENDLLTLEIPPRPMIVSPWLRQGTINMVSAPRGIGKSWLVHGLVTAITRNMEIGSWKTSTPVHCLIVDGEMSGEDLQKRFRRLTKNLPAPVSRLDFMSADLMHAKGLPTPNLADPGWRRAVYDLLAGTDYGLVVFDNLSALAPGLDENAKSEFDAINQFLLSVRFLGVAVVVIHHSGKDVRKAAQRGTSAHEDALDTSIVLKLPPGYKQTDGCRFQVEFSKSRSVCGDGIKPFIFSLVDGEDETITWKTEARTFDPTLVIALLGHGTPQKEIPDIFRVDKAIVSRIKTKAVHDGLIEEERKGNCRFTAKGQRQLGECDVSRYLLS